jgi:hypothetical protein
MKIVKDVFPAHVAVVPAGFTDDVTEIKSAPATDGAYYVSKTRVVLTEDMITIAIDGPDGASIIFHEKYAEYVPELQKGSDIRVVTDSGKIVAFKKDTNCGCGSRLRSWNPYKTLNSIKDM